MSKEGFYLAVGSLEMQQIHALQLAMLHEVDRICRKHGKSYYLLFGTLLGAVRHGGFIPWDDDIDIGIFRDDYDEVLTLLEEELDSNRYCVQTAENDAGATFPYAKVRCQNTVFAELVAPPDAEHHQGVFIDLFPLDNVPDDEREASRMKRRFIRRNLAYRYKVEGYRSERWYVNAVLSLYALSDIPTLLTKRKAAMTACTDGQSRRVIAFPAATADYDTSYLERAQMSPPQDISFCGFQVMAPAQTEVQLILLFGDYRQLPPVQQRRGHLLRAVSIDADFWADELLRYGAAAAFDKMKEATGGEFT